MSLYRCAIDWHMMYYFWILCPFFLAKILSASLTHAKVHWAWWGGHISIKKWITLFFRGGTYHFSALMCLPPDTQQTSAFVREANKICSRSFLHLNTFLNPQHNMCQLIIHHKHYKHAVNTEQFLRVILFGGIWSGQVPPLPLHYRHNLSSQKKKKKNNFLFFGEFEEGATAPLAPKWLRHCPQSINEPSDPTPRT